MNGTADEPPYVLSSTCARACRTPVKLPHTPGTPNLTPQPSTFHLPPSTFLLAPHHLPLATCYLLATHPLTRLVCSDPIDVWPAEQMPALLQHHFRLRNCVVICVPYEGRIRKLTLRARYVAANAGVRRRKEAEGSETMFSFETPPVRARRLESRRTVATA